MKKEIMAFPSRVVHAGGHPDKSTGAVIPPIYLTSTYVQSSPGSGQYEYTRSSNPTRDRLEECLASLEEGKVCSYDSDRNGGLYVGHASLR